MNIDHLRYFLVLSQEMHFSRAAERLSISQSGLSHALAALEKELGVPLCEKSGRGIRLGRYGLALLPPAQQIGAAADRCLRSFQMLREGVGTLRLKTIPLLIIPTVTKLCRQFKETHPGCDFQFSTGMSSQVCQSLQAGEIDIGFCSKPVEDPGLEYAPIQRRRLVAAVPLDHPLASRETFPLEALDDEPFMILEKGAGAEVEAIFKERGIKPRVNFTTWDDYAIMAMVEKGLGISILTEMIMRRCPYKVVAKSLEQPVYRDIVLAFRGKERSSLALQRFIEYLPRR